MRFATRVQVEILVRVSIIYVRLEPPLDHPGLARRRITLR